MKVLLAPRPRLTAFFVAGFLAGFAFVATAQAAGTPAGYVLANVTSDNATVVWASLELEAGRVEFAESTADLLARTGTFRQAFDDAGASQAHHVTLGEAALFDNRLTSGRPPLRSGTAYVLDVVSGGTRYDNSGLHFSLHTPSAGPPRLRVPQPVVVTVTTSGGTTPVAAVLTYWLENGNLRSQTGAAPVLSGQARILDLAQLLSDDLATPWEFTGSQTLALSVSGGAAAPTTSARDLVTASGQVQHPPPLILPRLNHAPLAAAGPDQVALTGAIVTLQGSGSDPDADLLGYSWAAASGNPATVTLLGPKTTSPSFVPSVVGVYLFTLTVTDSYGASASDTAAVVVHAPTPPGNDHASNPGETAAKDTLVDSTTPGVGTELTGTLASAGEEDWFRFYVKPGYVYMPSLSAGSLASGRLTQFAADGSTVTQDGSTQTSADVVLAEFRPSAAGVAYLRVRSATGTGTGSYRIRVAVRQETLVAPPSASLLVTQDASGLVARLRLGSLPIPVSGLRVLISHDAASLTTMQFQLGAAASGWAAVYRVLGPTLAALELSAKASPVLSVQSADDWALFSASSRGGAVTRSEPLTILSIAASNFATTVAASRPSADAGPAVSWMPSQLSDARVHLDGRLSSDSNVPARSLSYVWRQVGGPSVTLDNPSATTPSFAPAGPGIYRFALTCGNGLLSSPAVEVPVGLDLPGKAPFVSVAVRTGGSTREDATTGVVEAVSSNVVILDARGSVDPLGGTPSYAWQQLEGPLVDLSLAGGTVSFVPGLPGLYRFRLRATGTLGYEARPAVVSVHVRPANGIAPSLSLAAASGGSIGGDLGETPWLASPGALRVKVGQAVTIVAQATGASSESQSFYWRQISGPTIEFAQRGGAEGSARADSYIDFTPRRAGLAEFECRLRLSSTGMEVERRIRVCVDDTGAAVPQAQATLSVTAKSALDAVVDVAPGSAVRLSGTGTASTGGLSYAWVQVGGPDLETTSPNQAGLLSLASTPTAQRLCIYQLFVQGALRSEPAVLAFRVTPAGYARASRTLEPGVNLVGVPLAPAVGRSYTVEDLAIDSGSPFVAWVVTSAEGRRRFSTWLRGGSGRPAEVDATTGYVVLNTRPDPAPFQLSGSLWPAGTLVRKLSAGLDVIGYPQGAAASRDANSLLRAVGGQLVTRWNRVANGRARPECFIPSLGVPAFALETGRGYLVSGVAGSLDLGRLMAKTAQQPEAASASGAQATYALRRDWNLVSPAVFSSPAIGSASALAAALSTGGAQIARVRRWNGTGFDEALSGGGGDFPVAFGQSYLVFNSGLPATVTLSGSPVSGDTVSLASGFSLAASVLTTPVSAASFVAQAAAQRVTVQAVMELAGSRWLAYLPGQAEVSSPAALRLAQGAAILANGAGSVVLGTLVQPVISPAQLADATLGVSYAASLAVTGTPPISWSVSGGALAQGLTLAADGSVGGTPTATGSFAFAARASNAAGTAERSFTLTVVPMPAGLRFARIGSGGSREYAAQKDGSALVEIPEGSFAMGSSGASVAAGAADTDEVPVHAVTISRYLLGKYAVTNTQYKQYLDATTDAAGPFWHQGHHPSEALYKDHTPYGWTGAGSTPYSTSPDLPVVGVDWYDAYAYCAWAGLRLPTEAELEFAARGPSGRSYPWGEDAPGANGRYRANAGNLYVCCSGSAADGFAYAAPGGSFGPGAPLPRADGSSPLGVFDLSGNSWQWAHDWYAAGYYAVSASKDPTGPSSGTQRVLRGGSWYNTGYELRGAYRQLEYPTARYGSYGFRVAQSFEPTVVTKTLPAARQGSAYNATLAALSSSAVDWSLVEGALPAGLTLSSAGTISGVPSAVTVNSFTARATSSRGLSEASYLLFVDPAQTTVTGINDYGFRELLNEKDGSAVVEIPSSTFPMGSTTASVTALQAATDETPYHYVSLSRYFIGKFEVSNAQYKKFLDATADAAGPSWHQGHHPSEPLYKDHTPYGWTGVGSSPWSTSPASPVVGVDWYDAYAYCAWAGVRLPTEAEAEYASRGIDFRKYPWGNEEPGTGGRYRANAGNLSVCCSDSATDGFRYLAPVGSFGSGAGSPRADGRSPFGLFDTAGNAWEWAQDWYGLYSPNSSVNPTGPVNGTQRVLRGGSWYNAAFTLRSAYRGYDSPTTRYGNYGFRVAMSFEPSILTKTLTASRQGSAFTTALSALSTVPVTWSLVEGALPPGLTLSSAGNLSGVPAAVTVSTFTVRARSSQGIADRSYLLFVDPAQTTVTGINDSGFRELENRKDGSAVVEIPASTFPMGSTTASVTAQLAEADESPYHYVSLSRYFIGKFEVSNAQYKKFLAATTEPAGPFWHQGHHPSEPLYKDHTPYGWTGAGSTPWSTSPSSPVVGVDWYDAYAYCAWAGVRLPTESEAEYSARGIDFRKYPWGSEEPGTGGRFRANAGNLSVCCSDSATDGFRYLAPAGSFGSGAASPRADGRSPFGLFDVAGNAWEWAHDWYGPYGPNSSVDPTGPMSGNYRTLRGGSWYTTGYFLRTAYRGYDAPTSRYSTYGFRVAMSFEPTIVTQTLTVSRQASAYTTTLSALSTVPVTWSLVEGQLPTGLTLTSAGTLSGTPQTVSVASFTVRARSSRGIAERSFLLFVDPAGTTSIGLNPSGFRELSSTKDTSLIIEIPAGTFSMGSTTASVQAGLAETTEAPLHSVSLSRYFVGKYLVTNAQYKKFLDATTDPAGPALHQGHDPGEGTAKDHKPFNWNATTSPPYSTTVDSPVVGIDWYDAYAYCVWAGLRLPTEAEFEYAARGTDGRVYPWGSELPGANGVYRTNAGNLSVCCSDSTTDGFQYAAPVGSYGAAAVSPRGDGRSPFGAYDMVGNVWEWSNDRYGAGYYAGSPSTNPSGPATGSFRSLRGGSWYNSAWYLRANYRGYDAPANRYASYGFRVAR